MVRIRDKLFENQAAQMALSSESLAVAAVSRLLSGGSGGRGGFALLLLKIEQQWKDFEADPERSG